MPHRLNFRSDRACRQDRLGHDRHIRIITAMVTEKGFRTPFCMGIFGPWGSGKTSFMRLLEEEIRRRKSKPVVIPVWFNPWRYQKETHLIVPFLKTIEREVLAFTRAPDDGALKKAGNAIGRVASALAYGVDAEVKTELLKVKLIDAAKSIDCDEKLQAQQEAAQKVLADGLSAVYFDAVNELTDAIDEDTFRIAVFIDDLDRCLPEKAVELLEAIKLFLDIPGYLFVIGVDREVVKRGIAWRYRHLDRDGGNEKEKAISPEDYLEKMIQLPIDLPPIEAGCRIGYIESLLKGSRFLEHARLIDIGVGDNPRSLKRFVNLLAYTARIAETIRTDSGSPVVKKHFIAPLYIKWTVIVYRFREDFGRIKGNPDHLLEMQRAALPDQSSRGEPDGAGEAGTKTAISLHPALRDLLRETPHFPEDPDLIRHFIYLANTASVSTETRGTARGASKNLRPGDMVRIPAGPFLYREDKKTVTIDDDYFIGAFPVTNREYKKFVDATGHRVPLAESKEEKPFSWDEKTKAPPEGKEDHPVVLVSHEDAEAYCQWLSKEEGLPYRLPTEQEWEKAARGEDGREYPWGEEFDPSKCNFGESGIGSTSPVTQFPEGQSPYGCFDMAGNVWEWTSSYFDNDKDRYVVRGGSWGDDAEFCRSAFRGWNTPGNRDWDFGFRLARGQSPGRSSRGAGGRQGAAGEHRE